LLENNSSKCSNIRTFKS